MAYLGHKNEELKDLPASEYRSQSRVFITRRNPVLLRALKSP